MHVSLFESAALRRDSHTVRGSWSQDGETRVSEQSFPLMGTRPIMGPAEI